MTLSERNARTRSPYALDFDPCDGTSDYITSGSHTCYHYKDHPTPDNSLSPNLHVARLKNDFFETNYPPQPHTR